MTRALKSARRERTNKRPQKGAFPWLDTDFGSRQPAL